MVSAVNDENEMPLMGYFYCVSKNVHLCTFLVLIVTMIVAVIHGNVRNLDFGIGFAAENYVEIFFSLSVLFLLMSLWVETACKDKYFSYRNRLREGNRRIAKKLKKVERSVSNTQEESRDEREFSKFLDLFAEIDNERIDINRKIKDLPEWDPEKEKLIVQKEFNEVAANKVREAFRWIFPPEMWKNVPRIRDDENEEQVSVGGRRSTD